MASFPIVLLPREPRPLGEIRSKRRFIPQGRRTPEEQRERFGARFDRIAEGLAGRSPDFQVAADPADIAPGRVLVLEVRNAISEFAEAANRLGFEWLGELAMPAEPHWRDEGQSAPEDAQPAAGDPPAGDGSDEPDPSEADLYGDRLYVALPSDASLRGMLRLWGAYQRGEPAGADRSWLALFAFLKDLRVWSPQDRIEPDVIDYVHARLRESPGRPVRMELDLWFRGDEGARGAALLEVAATLEGIGGSVVDTASLPEIEYLAMLADVPAERAVDLAALGGPLAAAVAVMSVRPQSAYRSDAREPAPSQYDGPVAEPGRQERPAIVALLDGHVLAEHRLLAGRVDEVVVDVPANLAPAASRRHGTAMASLIIHGDLGASGGELRRRLVVAPILASGAGGGVETTPIDKLPLSLVKRAVEALVSGLDGAGALRPSVVVFNHSICDTATSFSRRPTPWGRLLDYLSHRHRLLFVVAAGNCEDVVPLPNYAGAADFLAADPIARQNAIIRALERHRGHRRLLSPAEAMNALTVGAVHADGAGACALGVDPFVVPGMTNIGSRVGPGIQNAVKPEFIMPGGRQVAGYRVLGGSIGVWGQENGHLGHLVAAPGASVLAKGMANVTGTSNAAALATRAAVAIADAVIDVMDANGISWLDLPTRAVILKALLVHGCAWGDVGTILDQAYPPPGARSWRPRRDAIASVVGFGQPDVGRVTEGASNRITLLAHDQLTPGELHVYRLPLPRELLNARELRRLTLTLAWSSSVIPRNLRTYRGSRLKLVDGEGKQSGFWQGVRTAGLLQPHPQRQEAGNVFHYVLQGEHAIKSLPEDGVFLGVQSRLISGGSLESVPYALAVTAEIGTPLPVTIYDFVRARISAKTRARAQAGSR